MLFIYLMWKEKDLYQHFLLNHICCDSQCGPSWVSKYHASGLVASRGCTGEIRTKTKGSADHWKSNFKEDQRKTWHCFRSCWKVPRPGSSTPEVSGAWAHHLRRKSSVVQFPGGNKPQCFIMKCWREAENSCVIQSSVRTRSGFQNKLLQVCWAYEHFLCRG